MKIHLIAHENNLLAAKTDHVDFHCWTTLINMCTHHYPIKRMLDM